MFGKNKKQNNNMNELMKGSPALRISICTGEKTAGFIDNETGHFHDLYLITSQKELEVFCQKTGTTPETIERIY